MSVPKYLRRAPRVERGLEREEVEQCQVAIAVEVDGLVDDHAHVDGRVELRVKMVAGA
ncbi:MAG: hypothetical protein HRU13_08945 [Phycisphaerales bacterium]|nr:hypothetical protein [Phycisphaerales bacterium]